MFFVPLSLGCLEVVSLAGAVVLGRLLRRGSAWSRFIYRHCASIARFVELHEWAIAPALKGAVPCTKGRTVWHQRTISMLRNSGEAGMAPASPRAHKFNA